MGKTKLDSIDKVVDLIRTVSRDISPDAASKDCDCYIDFYQEKENQTDDVMCQSIESEHDYASKIEAQQAEIEMLNAELDKKVCVNNCSMCQQQLLFHPQSADFITLEFDRNLRVYSHVSFRSFTEVKLRESVEGLCMSATAIGVN